MHGRPAPQLPSLRPWCRLGHRAVARAKAWATTLVLGVLCSASALAAPYTLDRSHTFVYWEVLHMGTSTSRGRFDRLDGRARFDPGQRVLDVQVDVKMASISTGFAPFDNVLRGSRLLAVADHPVGRFVSRSVVWDAGGQAPAQVQGEITLKGITQPLTLATRRWHCGNNPLFGREVCGGDFEASLSRAAFGMDFAAALADDRVRILIQVEAVRGDAPGGGPGAAAAP